MLAVNWLSPRDLIETFGTVGLILVVFVESGLLPVPLPGDSILFLAGAFCATSAHSSDPHLNLAVVVIGSFVAAVAGAQLGYADRPPLRHPPVQARRPALQDRVPRAGVRTSSTSAGPRSVVLARFIPFVRTVVPILAGTGRMPARKFAIAERDRRRHLGGRDQPARLLAGKSIDIDKYIYPIVAVIIVLSLIPPFLEYRKHRRSTSGNG